MNLHPRRFSSMDLAFALLGSLVVLFILAPLLSALFSSSPASLWQALQDGEVLASIRITCIAGLLAVLLGLLTGVPLAYLLARRRFRGRELVLAVVNLPVLIPHTAAGVALLLVYGRQGLLGGPLKSLGFYFTENAAGIVVAMLFVGLPLLVDTAREAFALVDERLERVARTLGAGPWRAFGRVTLPLAWRGIMAGAILMWARGISEFGAVVILAYNPKVISVLIYERFAGFGLSAALPITALLLALALLILILVRTVLLPRRRQRAWGGRR